MHHYISITQKKFDNFLSARDKRDINMQFFSENINYR